MIKFTEWLRLVEDGAAAGGSGTSTGVAIGGGTDGAATAPSGDGSGENSSGSEGTSAPPSEGGTTTKDVARVPMRLGCCGLCYPNCTCNKKKRKKRKKK